MQGFAGCGTRATCGLHHGGTRAWMTVMNPQRVLDRAARRRHKLRNLAQSILLLGGMLVLLSLCAWLVFGAEGALWALGGWVMALMLSPRISPALVLRLYRAQRLVPWQFPEGHEILNELSRRAGIERPPELYYLPSATLNAFALGRSSDAVIAVTDGLLRTLSPREFAGVLAHELSHIANRDLWVMNLADGIGRLTNLMALAGVLLLAIGLPLYIVGYGGVPWLLVVTLVLAPTIGNLLQMGLSRAREYDADLDAAALTGDPAGLAAALMKMEYHQARLWERLLLPGRKVPEPSLLRSHPPTESRIDRLMSLYPGSAEQGDRYAGRLRLHGSPPASGGRPRWRVTGLWH